MSASVSQKEKKHYFNVCFRNLNLIENYILPKLDQLSLAKFYFA
ncbi:Uncharacterised protein [Mycoplasmopsis arginini]|nr:Uncharacterised protein [Chlamydia abortus]SGA15737.1 Uncharacterised protein [Mycoplasmopsis arginini]SGA32940.1 Uncharacterised protein [Chlamydia abortus]